MILWRNVYLPLKINRPLELRKKECGQVEWCAGLFYLLFLAIVLCSQLQVEAYCATSSYLEDALAASNLASAVIDLEEYGKTNVVLIQEPGEAYERFCVAVKGNLQLNDAWECRNKQLIAGKVSVARYIVYNVKDDMVTVSEVASNGEIFQWQGTMGSVMTPDDTLVVATGIYSEITFPVEGFCGVKVNARKGKLVDVVVESG